MDETEYQRLKRVAKTQHGRAIEIVEKQFIDRLEAIEKVWELTHNYQPHRKRKPRKIAYGSLRKAMLKAFQQASDVFTEKQIRQIIEKDEPFVIENCAKGSVSGRLHQFVKQGIVSRIKAGRGRTPSEYKIR